MACAVLMGAALLSCRKESAPSYTFQIAQEYLTQQNFTQESQYVFIPVQTNIDASDWQFESDAPWCVIGPSITGTKGIMISVANNEEPDVRNAETKVSAYGHSYTFKVVQTGYGPAILVSDLFVPAGGGQAVVKVTANIPYTVEEPQIDAEDMEEGEDAWITKASETKALAETSFGYEILPNFTAGRRIATIDVKAQNREYASVDKTCTITQDIVNDNATEDVIGGAEKVTVLSALAVHGEETNYYSRAEYADQNGKNGSPDFLFDGDPDTYYLSPRYPAQATADYYKEYGTELPFRLVFELVDESKTDYMVITHASTNEWRKLKKFNIYTKASADAEEVLVNAEPFTCSSSTQVETFFFDQTLVNPKYIILEVVEAFETSNLVRIQEVEFYGTNRHDTQEWILKVFTDLSCSALKEGVTKRDINAMAAVAPYIAKNVAMPLYQNTYPEAEKEFRIHAYEPYSNPATFKLAYNIRLYTELDNPTGIVATSGQTFIVCVGDIPAGHTVRFAVNGDQESGLEFNYGAPQFVQVLRSGVNVVNVAMSGTVKEGMIFIIHTDANLTAASEPVNVHILPGVGNVVGYYDTARHDDAQYKELLSHYPYKYFFLKGAKYIMAAHTQQLRAQAPGSYSGGMKRIDQIVGWEKELMGLGDRAEFNNHIMGVTTNADGVHMDAADRRIRFKADAVGYYATQELVDGSPWGLGHEIGHVNQPSICWESTIESSNNLFSNFVTLNCGLTESRGHSLVQLANSYGLPWYQLGNTGQYQNEDAELHMRMNWQLWNYFHRCEVDTQFWPKVFEQAREHPTPGMYYWQYGYSREDPGTCQLMFYEQVCDAAQMDLTEFFETWGFFHPVDATYGQYQSPIAYSVSADMINEARARVAAKNYPKAPAIQYLEDRTRRTNYWDYANQDPGLNKDIKMGYYTLFKDKVAMTTVPSYTLNGRNVKVQDCAQAAAVEIRSAAGELLYFSNLDNFDVPERTGAGKTIDLSTAQFQAVQWDGVRKDMTRK